MTQAVFHAVVLAGQRKGVINPLATAAGVSHKCLMPMVGKTLIEHTITALVDAPQVGQISIVIEDRDVLARVPYVEALLASGKARCVMAQDNLFSSVKAAMSGPQAFPALITTADNVLLTPEMIGYFTARLDGLDAAVALVRKEVLLEKYPDGQRNFHRFRDGHFSNCNLYALVTPKSLEAARVFEGGGQFAKARKRAIQAFGLVNALLYKYEVLKVKTAVGRVGKRHGIALAPIELPFPEAPIDVDNERTAELAAEILQARLDAGTA